MLLYSIKTVVSHLKLERLAVRSGLTVNYFLNIFQYFVTKMYNRDIKVQFLQAFAFADQILPGSGTFDLSVGPLLKLYCSMKLSIRKKKYRCLLEKKNSTTSLLLCVKAEILLFRNIKISRNSPCFSVRTVKIVMRLFPCCQRAAKADRFSRLFPPANRKLCFDWKKRSSRADFSVARVSGFSFSRGRRRKQFLATPTLLLRKA